MIIEAVRKFSERPQDGEAFTAWLELRDAVDFLKNLDTSNETVLYASMRHVFIHTVLVPDSALNPVDTADLMRWDCNPSSGWGVSYSFGAAGDIWLDPPLDGCRSKTLEQGEQLVFTRSFEGRLGDRAYFEILQKLSQVLEVHFIAERNAYCRLDHLGDLEDVIRIIETPPVGKDSGSRLVTIERQALDTYMVLTHAAAVVTFDFTRFCPRGFSGWGHPSEPRQISDGALHYKQVLEPGCASYMRGFQIIRPLLTKTDLRGSFNRSKRPEKFETFVAYDWKNGEMREISCAPGATANYFTASDLPFELSPAFFRPDVLLKYKADSDKYELRDRTISCRGTWHLETYDINETGQVHTYLCYLRALPYEEQLHWKAYNEPPKSPISKRALKTDFEGSWDLEYDPLESLRAQCRELDQEQAPWWRLRGGKSIDQVHSPVTSSADEWANELLHLDQLIVEGFNGNWLRHKGETLGRKLDPSFGSIKLLEESLIGLGFEQKHAEEVTAPFKTLRLFRTKLKGHAQGREATGMKREVLSKHRTFSNHFRELCRACDESLRTVTGALGAPLSGPGA
jgi:hypothetical protein